MIPEVSTPPSPVPPAAPTPSAVPPTTTLRSAAVATITPSGPSTGGTPDRGPQVAPGPTSVVLGRPTSPTYAAVTTLSATASAAGTVAFFAGSTALCSGVSTSTSSPYVATCSWTPTTPGPAVLRAGFTPTGPDLAASTSAPVDASVADALSSLTTSTTDGTVDTPIALDVSASVRGTVAMALAGGGPICTTPTSSLTATCSWTPTTSGQFTVDVTLDPSDPDYAPSEGSLPVSVRGLATTLQLSGPSTAVYGESALFTAVASVPGTVSFDAGGLGYPCQDVATTLSAPYTATCSWTPPNGTAQVGVTSTLSPTDTTYGPSASTTVDVQLTYDVTITDASPPSAATIVSATATYTASSGATSTVDGVVSGTQVTFDGLGAGTLSVAIEVQPAVCYFLMSISGSIGSTPFVSSGSPDDQTVSTAEPITIDATTADPDAANDFSFAEGFDPMCA